MASAAVLLAYANSLEQIPVQSSNLKAVAYQADFARLYVWFQPEGAKESLYAYDDISPDLFDQLVAASSKGKFLDTKIKKAGYAYTHIY